MRFKLINYSLAQIEKLTKLIGIIESVPERCVIWLRRAGLPTDRFFETITLLTQPQLLNQSL